MELRALAEAVLRGERLEDKLAGGPALTDHAPGPALAHPPEQPGRPRRLRLDDGRPRAPFPRPAELHRPEARGRALHFFANHELLAAELMALCLLRFPEAPAAFRMGVGRTLREEQAHLRRYLDRMAELGVEIGDVPVGGHFWRVLAPMRSPLDYVAGMSLVFEQANLDHAAAWGRTFAACDDAATATLMREVLEDEVGHVKHGVRWFDRWRPQGEDRFAAFVRALPPGLDPIRARGPTLEVGPRLAAGLDRAFVTALEAHRGSKGRRPKVFAFVPEVEDLAAGRPAPSSGPVGALAADLAPVFGLLGGDDDLVLSDRPGDPEHRRQLAEAGLPSPAVVDEAAAAASEPDRIEAWGAIPAVARRLARLSARCRVVLDAPGDAEARLDKRSALPLRAAAAERGWLPMPWVGVACETAAAAAAALETPGPKVLKRALSAAGRHRRVVLGPPSEADRQFATSAALDGGLVVEPWIDRELDLGLVLPPEGPAELLRFFTDPRGGYRGHWLGPPAAGVPREVAESLLRHPAGGLDRLCAEVEGRVRARFPRGPLGVDMLIGRGPGGRALQPFLEINGRWTMGHVAARLRRRGLAPGSVGLWWHLRRADLRTLGLGRFAELAPALERHRPRTRRLGRRSAIAGGAIATNPPTSASAVLTVMVVDESQAALRARWSDLFPGLSCPIERRGPVI